MNNLSYTTTSSEISSFIYNCVFITAKSKGTATDLLSEFSTLSATMIVHCVCTDIVIVKHCFFY